MPRTFKKEVVLKVEQIEKPENTDALIKALNPYLTALLAINGQRKPEDGKLHWESDGFHIASYGNCEMNVWVRVKDVLVLEVNGDLVEVFRMGHWTESIIGLAEKPLQEYRVQSCRKRWQDAVDHIDRFAPVNA